MSKKGCRRFINSSVELKHKSSFKREDLLHLINENNYRNKKHQKKDIYPHESLAAGRGDAGRELAHWGGRLGRRLKIVL